jgi:hypothetical protein
VEERSCRIWATRQPSESQNSSSAESNVLTLLALLVRCRAELGRATWKLLHLITLRYPDVRPPPSLTHLLRTRTDASSLLSRLNPEEPDDGRTSSAQVLLPPVRPTLPVRRVRSPLPKAPREIPRTGAPLSLPLLLRMPRKLSLTSRSTRLCLSFSSIRPFPLSRPRASRPHSGFVTSTTKSTPACSRISSTARRWMQRTTVGVDRNRTQRALVGRARARREA